MTITPVGGVTVTWPPTPEVTVVGWKASIRPDEREGRDDDGRDDRQVVALAGVAPPLGVQAEQGEHDDRAGHDPVDRGVAQIVVARRDVRVESQPVGENVGEGDERPVDDDLRQGVPVERGNCR